MGYIKDQITVIMTVWKRDNYRLQLEHIKNQSNRPHQIWIYQNESHVDIDISDEEKNEYNISIIQSRDINFKFHGRFVLPLLCDTEYCVIFDDDTIPGSRWLSHALSTSQKHNCIVGANGRTLDEDLNYKQDTGDGHPVNEDTRVDFVGSLRPTGAGACGETDRLLGITERTYTSPPLVISMKELSALSLILLWMTTIHGQTRCQN